MSREKFFSRQNEVYLEDNKVYKVHKNRKTAKEEVEIVKALYDKNVLVPKVISTEDNIICMEYIKGDLLLEKLLEYSKSESKTELRKLANDVYSWFDGFYNVFPLKIRGDINARNFICSDNGVVGLDFEDTKTGRKEEDIGKMAAFFLTYEPTFEKNRIFFIKILIDKFEKNLNLNRDIIKQEFSKELDEMQVRRDNFKIDKKKAQEIIF